MNGKINSKELTLMGMFTAIIFVLTFTPLGFIQLPFIKATILHIPVIIGSLLLGAKYGGVLGFMFGVASLISNTMTPAATSFTFSPFIPVPGMDRGSFYALIVCFIPRILVGILPVLAYKWMKKLFKNKFQVLTLAITGIIGSLTNTLLVMHLIFLLFKDSYAAVKNLSIDMVYNVILGIIAVNGIPEAIMSAVITAAIFVPIRVVKRIENKK